MIFLNLPSAIQPADHPYKLHLKPAECNPYSLPGSVVEAGTLSRSKSELERFLNIH